MISILYDLFVAVFIGGAVTGELNMSFTGNIGSPYPLNFMAEPTLSTLAVFLSLSAFVFAALRAIRRCPFKAPAAKTAESPEAPVFSVYFKGHVRCFIGLLLIVGAAWTLLLAYFYPGTSMNDQLYCINKPLASSRTHPLLLSLALSGLVNFGHDVLGSANAGLAIYVEIQVVVCAAIVAFCCVWMRYRGVPRTAVGLTGCFFAFVPIVSSYAVSTVKDTPFAYALLLWLPFLGEAMAHPEGFWRKRSSYVFLVLLVMGTALTRNNGIALAVALVLILGIASRGVLDGVRFSMAALIAFALVLAPGLYARAQGVDHYVRETVGIPLQQVASVECDEGADIPKSCRKYIDKLMPGVREKGLYWPMCADGVKYGGGFKSSYLQDHAPAFVKVYLKLGLANPMQYARAYASATYGNWSLTARAATQSYFVKLSSNGSFEATDKVMRKYGLHNHSLLPDEINGFIGSTYVKFLDVFPGPGLCFALVLLLGYALTVRWCSPRPIMLVMPYVLLWGTLMLATPLSTALRYAFPMLVALPVLASLLFCGKQR